MHLPNQWRGQGLRFHLTDSYGFLSYALGVGSLIVAALSFVYGLTRP